MSAMIFLILLLVLITTFGVFGGREIPREILERVRKMDERLRRNEERLTALAATLSRLTAPTVSPDALAPDPVTPPPSAAAAAVAEPPVASPPEPTPEPSDSPPIQPSDIGATAPAPSEERAQTPIAPEAPAVADTEPAAASAPPSPPPREPTRGENLADLEKRFGTQWVVWVGGLALALGGIFLVRYSIEQGYFGPAARVTTGAVLALALIALGEWTRRQELRTGLAGVATAHIPSIFTAAGTTVAYATAYGAYALYHFMSAPMAFVLLGIVALLTLAAALVHGPMLAGLGLIGAYVTPLLVSTHHPNYWALYVYLAVVTASAYALARARLWRWLAITAAVFGIFWMAPGIAVLDDSAIAAHAFFALIGFGLCAVFIVAGFILGPPDPSGRPDPVSSGVLAGYVLGAFMLTVATWHDSIALLAVLILLAATTAIVLRAESAAYALPIAAALATLVVIDWACVRFIYFKPQTDAVFFISIAQDSEHIVFGAASAILLGAAGFRAQGRSSHAIVPIMWAATASLAPIAILIATYYRQTHFERSITFAAVALLMAVLYGWAAETIDRRGPRPGHMVATAAFACSGLASLALALTMALEKGWLTVALALMAPGIALVAARRPLPLLRWAVAVIAGLLIARIIWDPRIVGDDIGTTPIFNWLLYGYGVPALAFWAAGHVLRRSGDDTPTRMAESAAILFTVLLSTFEIRHLVYAGDIYHPGSGLAETALNVASWLATTIGLERAFRRTLSVVHDWGARILGTLALVTAVWGLGFRYNPLQTNDPVGGPIFNLILLGYALPAVLMAALARVVKASRPNGVYMTAAITAIVFALGYLTLEVRTLFHGPMLRLGVTTDAEQYTYSAVWLAFGVALLLAGVALRSQPARLASAAVVTLTAGKVFLHDLAGVQGVYRAFSFIGLGLVLMGIGYLYQRLLFPPRAVAPVEPGG